MPTSSSARATAVLVVAGLALSLPIATARPSRADEPAPFVSAHRGGAAYAPENTLVAFANGVRLGVDELEADTQLTADGHLVVIHDDTVDRTTDCSGTVPSMTLAEVRACDAAYWFSPGQPTTAPNADLPHPLRGRGVVVPTAEELLDLVARTPEVRLSIEIKDIPGEANFDAAGVAVAEALVPAIQAAGIADRTVVQSFWPAALEAVKRLAPELATQLLTTTETGVTAAANAAYVAARGHDVSAPNHDAPDLAAGVAAAHAAGAEVVTWTPDDPADVEAAAAAGVDGVITNFPACALQVVGRPVRGSVVPAGVPGDTPACPGGSRTDRAERLAAADRPTAEECEALRPDRWAPAIGSPRPDAAMRVVALQFKQDVRHVATYDDFRTKMRCLMEEHVVPVLDDDLPTLVVFNEDIGLMTLAVGSRGATVREQAATPLRAPAGDGAPAGIAAALGQLNGAYAPQIAEYQRRFGPIDPRKQVFVGATDTMVRAYSQTFADIARDYGVYAVASNNMARYEASTDPLDLALFADPDLEEVTEVYVATSPTVTNQTAIWGPEDVDPDAPAGERNLLFRNDKVPLTPIEKDLIALDEGPASGPEGRANAAGVVVEGFHLGFATSLPAFTWGYPFGARPADLDPCADTRSSFMPCMDALGVDTVVQAEANPARWVMTQPGGWQPLEWMASTWRTVADPSVGFETNITAHMVGNLLDLVFDGQSAITRRDRTGEASHYVGNLEFEEGIDPEAYRLYGGGKPEFEVLAPWVVPDAPRDELRAVGDALAPGSGDPMENDYLETAVWADLPAPADAEGAGAPAGAVLDPPTDVAAGAPLPTTGGGAGVAAGGALVLGLAVLVHRRS